MSTRDVWERHPHIGGPAGLLLHFHDAFRRASSALLAESRNPEPRWSAMDRTFHNLYETLHHHHHAEEVMLFPRLIDGTSEGLVEDHEALMHALDIAKAALAARAEADEALGTLDTLLQTHLDEEEAIVVPFLLEHPHF